MHASRYNGIMTFPKFPLTMDGCLLIHIISKHLAMKSVMDGFTRSLTMGRMQLNLVSAT